MTGGGPALGPAGGRHEEALGLYCERLLGVAPRYGVTRLADITGLDRLGLPVWQAVRPAGRSLSVHQGKGTTPLNARIGALCEAIECDCAERAEADGPLCRFEALPEAERAPELGDYSRCRSRAPPDEIQWSLATDLLSGRAHYLPHELVSLDFTGPTAPWVARSSTGLAMGENESDAIGTALWEVLERDAVGAWDRASPLERQRASLDVESVPFGWFRGWRERFAALGIRLRLFALSAVAGLPAFIVSIDGREEFGSGYRRFSGTAAHPDPEIALFKALAEALQSRLTFIAGVRDDLLPSEYATEPDDGGLPPVPPGIVERRWDEVAPAPPHWEETAARLARLGYAQIAMKRLDDGAEGLAVVKLFVPGLGSLRRTRRSPG